MFTGLIQTTGRVERLIPTGADARLQIRPDRQLQALEHGESIAVDGVCLTLEQESGSAFSVYASSETLSRTTVGGFRSGARVNLERALALGDRLGGHFVSGHVDCLAAIDSVREAGQSRIYRLSFAEEWAPLVVPKGSVALDGVSLTINDCGKDFLEVNIIPATREATTINQWSPGRPVNMETDLIGKYVQRMLAPWQGESGAGGQAARSGLSLETLQKNGFL